MRPAYLLDKISNAPFRSQPFRHIEINNFFSREDFDTIVRAPEIAIEPQVSDESLIDELSRKGYKLIAFPGCVTDKAVYADWHRNTAQKQTHNQSSCEGFGICLRLGESRTPIITELLTFLGGAEFQSALAEAFGINSRDVYWDAGIQKYLVC